MPKRSGKKRSGHLAESRPSSKPPAHIQLEGQLPVLPPGYGCSSAPLLSPEVRTLVEDGEGDAMISADPVLTPEECAAWIAWGEATGFVLEKHAQTSQIAHRDNWRLAVESEVVARAIFARLAPCVPAEVAGRSACSCNANIRLYRYGPGQRFGPHIDQDNSLASGAMTEFTVLLYLNDEGLEGGETLFHGVAEAHSPRCRRPASSESRLTALPALPRCRIMIHIQHPSAGVHREVRTEGRRSAGPRPRRTLSDTRRLGGTSRREVLAADRPRLPGLIGVRRAR